MDKRAYWIWAQHAFGAGSSKPWSIYKRFNENLEEFYEGGTVLWNSMSFISEKEARQLHMFTINEAEAMLELAEKLGQKVITPEDILYPEALKNIDNPPAVLYYKGKFPDVDDTPTVGIVGARKASERAINAAMTIGYQLALSQAIVVSGGALGIDTAAHKGALRGMGKTIAVLPCGLTNGYLVENFMLRERIASEGLLVTEYPADTGVNKGTFQVRNRIISGLSCAVLIVEAEQKSGSLITAKHAKEQNRDVFVYGNERSFEMSEGCKGLVSDGAKMIHSADEILDEYSLRFNKVMSTGIIRQEETPNKNEKVEQSITAVSESLQVLSDSTALERDKNIDDLDELGNEAKSVVKALNIEPKHISELEVETGLMAHEILAGITELEIMGKIKSHSGNRYSL